MDPLLVELSEWQQVGPAQDQRLKGLSLEGYAHARQIAHTLRRKLDIREEYDGLHIASNSFVGRIDVGPLRISIKPKLPAMPLTQLLRYAYGLRDLAIVEETSAPTERLGLHDLLASLLAAEIEELLHRVLARRYVRAVEKLESPRGRILISRLLREGGLLEARLSCEHYQRQTNWQLNQVLRAGAELASRMAEDRELRRRLQQVSAMFGDVQAIPNLTANDIDRADRELSRLTAACAPALTIIGLLQLQLGVTVDSSDQMSRMPGFLFDMNVFFQRLLSRFLHENLSIVKMQDERLIRNLFAYAAGGNPRRRSVPAPRPDYALYRDDKLFEFVDAKYRDIWERNLPPEWLYQLSVYALASPNEVSILLYATMSVAARDERIEIRQPVSWSSKAPASVIIRPVLVTYLADLVSSRKGDLDAKRAFADRLVEPTARSTMQLSNV